RSWSFQFFLSDGRKLPTKWWKQDFLRVYKSRTRPLRFSKIAGGRGTSSSSPVSNPNLSRKSLVLCDSWSGHKDEQGFLSSAISQRTFSSVLSGLIRMKKVPGSIPDE
ncbi:hypothetical protein L9F63_007722, partial [Diploptera punctata]